jgi:hypothetical protein
MPMRVELSVPTTRHGWERRTAESVWRHCIGMLRSAHAYSTGASAEFHVVCMWSALGLTLTGLLFALGLGGEIAQILATAG